MADKASIVGTNDKGQFAVSAPRSSIDRVDVIDVDLVLHTKGGDRLILPGAALEAMTATPPTIQFSDGPIGADGLLSSVDKVQTPPSSIPAMTSLTEFDQKKTEGKKNRTEDGKDKADEAAQQAQAQQVAPLPIDGHESSIDKLIAKAESMEADMRKKAFDPAPPKVYESPVTNSDTPGSQPQTSKIPLYMTLSEGNVVGAQTVGAKVYGAGGPTGSSIADGILTGDAAQYGRESLSGSAGADIFYADAFARTAGTWNATGASVLNETAYASLDTEAGLAPSGTAFYYAKEIALNVAGYIRRIDSVTISGLPTGISIQGATSLGGGKWSLASTSVVPTPSTLVLVYDVTTIHTLFDKDSDGDGVNDYVDILMSVNVTGMGTAALNVTKTFVLRFQDADSTADITNNTPFYVTGTGSGWSDIYVMETASAPHTIVTFAGTYDNTQSLADNATATAATADGNNTVYAGNSNDTILAGAGDDTVYAYAGDDAISAGNGNNIVWAGNGNDAVVTGTGDDTVHLGRGNNTLTDTGGNNTIDVILTKTGSATVSGNGKDVITITGDGDNTITVGDESVSYIGGDGDDTVSTQNGTDTIHVGNGNNVVTTGDGDKTIYAGAGNDAITLGTAAGTTVGTGNIVRDYGGSNAITTGDGDGRDVVSITGSLGTDVNTIHTGVADDGNADGDDTVITGLGTETIEVGDGDNIVTTGNGSKTVTAGIGDDTITLGTAASGTGTSVRDYGGSNAITTGDGNGKDVASITGSLGTDVNTIHTGTANDGNADGDDTVITGLGTETIEVGDGNNTVTTGDGDKTVTSGTGSDTITLGTAASPAGNYVRDYGGARNAITTGDGDGRDVISITGGVGTDVNTIHTGIANDGNADGDDTVITGLGTETIEVGDGDNIVTATGGDKTVTSGTGDDTITLGSAVGTTVGTGTSVRDYGGSNAITTGSGNGRDVISITGSLGTDVNTINVGTANDGTADGNDTVITGLGTETISVGDGVNLVTTGDGDKTVTAGTGNDAITLGTAAGTTAGTGNVVRDYGGSNHVTTGDGDGRDFITITGSAANASNWIHTGIANDGNADGDDTVITGLGTETIEVGDGDNIISATGGDKTVTSGTGDDTITLGTAVGTTVGTGTSVRDYGGSNAITTGSGNGRDVISITGSLGTDINTIDVGTANDGTADGDDTVITGLGTETIEVGDGDNTVTTGDGDKTVTTGTGNDAITLGTAAGTTVGTGNVVRDYGGSNAITTGSGDGRDVVSITGSLGADVNTIKVGTTNDSIADGDDTVITGLGTETISVGDGVNLVTTGNGDKTIYAGAGNDTITLGTAAGTTVGTGTFVRDYGGSNAITTGDGDGRDFVSITGSLGTDVNTIKVGTANDSTADGDDTVITGLGTETIEVGDGDNTVTTGDGDKTVTAGTGSDTITLGTAASPAGNYVRDYGGSNAITTGDGDGKDVVSITGGVGTDVNTIHTGIANDGSADGNDTVITGLGTETIEVGDGDNTVSTGDGDKTVTSGTGNDIITLGTAVGTTAGTGNTLGTGNIVRDYGGSNAITTDDGNGRDFVSITGSLGTDINTIRTGTANDGSADGDDTVITGLGTETIEVGDGNNTVTTGNGNKSVIAGTGIDTVITGTGNDTISVGDGTRNIVWADDGTNAITAGSGNDTLIGGAGADSIVAGGGNDWIYGGTGANVTLDGGSGDDWLSFSGIGASVTAGSTTLSDWLTNTGTITGVTLNSVNSSGIGSLTHTGAGTETDAIGNIENFIGSQGADILNLSGYTGASHILYGLAGNDVLTGSALDDTLYGGSGNDSLAGNAGNDIIFMSITSLQTTITATALAGTGIDALADAATLSYTSAGLTGASTITTTGQHNVANGGAGADTIVGGAGNDYFVSGTGEYSDTITGAYDTFIGGTGFDTVDHSSFSANLVIDLGNNLGRINGGAYIAEYSSIERILTGSGNDGITGTTNNEIFYAGNGSNSIWVGGGTDSAFGGTGNDYFYSAAGATTTVGSTVITNSAYYDGGGGYNEYALRAGVETINGSLGSDRLFYNNSAATTLSSVTYGVFVNLDSTNWVVTATGALTTTAGTSYWYNWTSAGGTLWTTAMVGDTSSSGLHGFYGDAAGDTYVGTIEQIYGSGYNDILIGNSANNWFFAAAGSDAMYGLAGADTFTMMYGGTVNTGADYIDGGNDVNGVADTYTLTANGNGTFSWAGGDLITFLSGNNIDRALSINLDSISHTDIVTTAAVNAANAGEISGWSSIVTVANVEHAYGGNYADFIYGSAAGNIIDGGAGNDTIYGYGGDDFIYAGSGADYIDGGTNTAGAGGGDWATYSGLTVSVEVYLADADLNGDGSNDQSAAGWASTQARASGQNGYDYDTLIGIENIEGSSYADRIAGDGNDNSLFGGVGNDTIFGGAGNDVINGGSDNDTIEGGSGNDSLNGGSGTDLLSYANSLAAVTVSLATNSASGGDATGDTISNFENLRGSAGNDVLTGSNGVNNTIYGGDGNDTIYGTTSVNASNYDTLYGDAGSDTLSLTVAQLATTYVYGGSGNAAGNATETGTDTLLISNNATLTSLNGSLIHSIEAINLANGSAQDVTAFSAQGNQANVRTLINNILDNSGSTTLHLYLDNNDRFNTSYSGAGGAGSLVSNTNTQTTYTYGGSNITVHWGSG